MEYICKPTKIKLYVNTAYKTMAQVKAETGCDAIINGGLFESNPFRACRRHRADKKTVADDGIARWGLAWDVNIVRCSQNWLHYYNFISCTCIVRDGNPEATLDYTKDMSGARQRTAMGVFADDRVWLYATHSSTTPEQLRQIALDAGVKHAIMLDGGDSTQCIFPNGTLTSARPVHNLICVWTEDKPEEPTKKEELKVPKKYIDISEHQGTIDFAKVKNEVDGVMIRAGYGRGVIDKQFVRNISECNRLGIPCGVYWFSYALNESMAKQEAEFCLAAIKPYKVELPVCFDFEYDSVNVAKNNGVTITKKIATSLVHAFCQTIEKAGYYAMNYTNKDYLSRYFDDTTLRYDLWLAQWPNVVDLNNPPSGAGIWQYTSKGKVSGISGNVDMDAAYKDYANIIRAAGLNNLVPTAEEPKPEEKTDKAKEWAISKGIVAEGEKLDAPITKAELVAVLYMLNNS